MVNHECKTCKFVTKNKTDLLRHTRTQKHLKNLEKSNSKCESGHISGHDDEKLRTNKKNVYVCDVCKKIFTDKSNMYRHRRKHNEEDLLDDKDKIKELKNEVDELRKQNEQLLELLETKNKKMVIKRKKWIAKGLKMSVWNENFGITCGEHECYIGCGRKISQGNFECGHIIAESKGGTIHIDNLKPVCSQCNKSMGTINLEEFKKNFFDKKSLDIMDSEEESVSESDSELESEEYIWDFSVLNKMKKHKDNKKKLLQLKIKNDIPEDIFYDKLKTM
jgi:hypothetical protein